MWGPRSSASSATASAMAGSSGWRAPCLPATLATSGARRANAARVYSWCVLTMKSISSAGVRACQSTPVAAGLFARGRLRGQLGQHAIDVEAGAAARLAEAPAAAATEVELVPVEHGGVSVAAKRDRRQGGLGRGREHRDARGLHEWRSPRPVAYARRAPRAGERATNAPVAAPRRAAVARAGVRRAKFSRRTRRSPRRRGGSFLQRARACAHSPHLRRRPTSIVRSSRPASPSR